MSDMSASSSPAVLCHGTSALRCESRRRPCRQVQREVGEGRQARFFGHPESQSARQIDHPLVIRHRRADESSHAMPLRGDDQAREKPGSPAHVPAIHR